MSIPPAESPLSDPNEPSPYRLAGGLFLMAFGYALASVCLFRVLTFTMSSTAFFVLYLAAAMPIGAYLAQRGSIEWSRALRISLVALVALALLLPAMGWLATRGPAQLISEENLFARSPFDVGLFWRRLGYQLLVVSPFFVVWGFAEFAGYQVAIRSSSRALRGGFYLIFVWALACALVVGYWTIPQWGWLRTLALVPLVALAAYHVLVPQHGRVLQLAAGAVAVLAWLGVGPLEQGFVSQLFTETPFNVGSVLHTQRLPWGDRAPAETSVLSNTWGKYTNLTLVEHKGAGGSVILGAYDGSIHWSVQPAGDDSHGLQDVVFDFVPRGGDVAILGAGGGRQVAQALQRSPKSVVAIDVIPEVFSLFEGDYAWANGYVYRSPVVETVAADGRSYVESSSREFDLILVPNTESWAAIVKALFEPGQRIHTVESFAMLREHLTPNGVVAVIKPLDVEKRLFNSFAASLSAAGLQVAGWVHPTQGFPGQPHMLLATRSSEALDVALVRGSQAMAQLEAGGFEFVDFRKTPPRGDPIYDESPWITGVLGLYIPPEKLRDVLRGIAVAGILGVLLVLGYSLRDLEPGETVAGRTLFVLAGISIGVNAVYLQNGVIFWLIDNLFNPLASFFVGTSLFLLAWGLSGTMLRHWRLLLVLGSLGIAGMFFAGDWYGWPSMLSMGCITVGSGLCFPLLGLMFQSRLLNLFIADAVGGFLGGLLGIWLPVLSGFSDFFHLLPWVSLSTVALVVLTVRLRGGGLEAPG